MHAQHAFLSKSAERVRICRDLHAEIRCIIEVGGGGGAGRVVGGGGAKRVG
jgi:hypothetical protein